MGAGSDEIGGGVSIPINEDFFEQTIIEHMVDTLGYEHLYGPDVPRTDSLYHDVCV